MEQQLYSFSRVIDYLLDKWIHKDGDDLRGNLLAWNAAKISELHENVSKYQIIADAFRSP